MKQIITMLGALLLLSCASETEKKVLDEIAEVYNADVSYSKSFVSNTNEKRTTFNVVVENSEMIDTLAPSVTTSNTALLVYDALTEDEKENYTDIEVFLVNKNKDTASYYYKMDVLAPISHKAKVFNDFSQRIVDKNYDQMDTLKSNADIPKSIAVNIKNGIAGKEKQHGSIKGYYPFGIAEETDEIGTIYQYQSYLLFADGYKLNYLIVVDVAKGKDKIIGYKFFN